jgi:hypothetical protein
MILTSSGEVLTNNHVIEGATSIRVTIPSSGRNYQAEVVGADPTHDVALIQLVGSSGLTPVAVGASSDLRVGEQLVAIGNAFGRGGMPSISMGTVAALDQTITAGGGTVGPERLHGVIRMNAPISPGESGGPIADRSGQVVGMITAGQPSDGSTRTQTSFAITTDAAVDMPAETMPKLPPPDANCSTDGPGGGAIELEVWEMPAQAFGQFVAAIPPPLGVGSIERHRSAYRLEHNPGHPAADQNGYVKLPNVDVMSEVADMHEANRSYEANLQVIKQAREMISLTIDMLRSNS